MKNYNLLEKVLVVAIILLIGDTIVGGPVGLIFRGERHFVLALIFLLGIYLGLKKTTQSSIFKSLSWSDSLLWPLWIFLINLIWILAIPAITGGSLMLAIEDAQSLVMLPIASLVAYAMQHKKMATQLMQWITGLTLILAICHLVLWIWLNCYPQPKENYYHHIASVFNGADSVFIFWQPSSSGDYARVFWISSIWLTIAVFTAPFIINKRYLFWVELILGCAICVSFTKGLWLGIFSGLIFCTLANLFSFNKGIFKYESIIKNWWFALFGIACSVLLVMLLDYVINGRISLMSRIPFVDVTDELSNNVDVTDELSNNVVVDESTSERILQTKALLEKWGVRPLFGFGYGAFVSDHVRDPSRPFLYEMLPFALLMKLGIVGFGLYFISLFGLIFSVLYKKRGSSEGLMFIGAVIAFFIAAHTNPILYSFVGMSVVFFILIWWTEMMRAAVAENMPDNQDRRVP